jgi:MFS transporter, SP family, xylose:H+ symportor
MIATTTAEPSTLRTELRVGYVWMIPTVAALGGLLFGWDWVVIAE